MCALVTGVQTCALPIFYTMAGNGYPAAHSGVAIHLYAANASMDGRWFYDADGELLVVPQRGRLVIATELGVLEVEPQEIALIPRGVRFSVALPDGPSRGYVCEGSEERRVGKEGVSTCRSRGARVS